RLGILRQEGRAARPQREEQKKAAVVRESRSGRSQGQERSLPARSLHTRGKRKGSVLAHQMHRAGAAAHAQSNRSEQQSPKQRHRRRSKFYQPAATPIVHARFPTSRGHTRNRSVQSQSGRQWGER